jgi:hypothetical protein
MLRLFFGDLAGETLAIHTLNAITLPEEPHLRQYLRYSRLLARFRVRNEFGCRRAPRRRTPRKFTLFPVSDSAFRP